MIHKSLALFCALLVGVCLPAAVGAAPAITQITGTATHGGSISISGSGFGVKSPAAPYFWAPLETSGDPSPLGIDTTWDEIANIAYVSGEGPAGVGAFKATNNSGNWTAMVASTGTFSWAAPGQKMYLYRKVKHNFSIFTPVNFNWKSWRVWGNIVETGAVISSMDGLWNDSLSMTSGWTVESAQGLWPLDGEACFGPVGQWNTNEILMRSNTNAVGYGDGYFQYKTNGASCGEVPYESYETRYLKLWDGNATPRLQRNYLLHGVAANHTMGADDRYWGNSVYLDTTWARVMIGNAATLAGSTQLEMQIPTAWADNSVQAVFNKGAFSAGQTVYLYVIDADNAVNASGYPVTIGGGGTTYTVTPSAGSNGSISPNTAQTVSSGNTAIFTVTPSAGYVAIVGGTCGGNLVGTTYTTSAITADCTVAATFQCKKLATPSGLSFVGLVANPPSNATLSFDWSDVTTHADGSALIGDLANYRTYWGTVSGGPYNTSSSASSQISVGPTNANVTYYARVAAESSVNSICNSDQTAEISLFADTVPPVLSGLNPSGNYPKTAANVALGVTTNEAATCRHGSAGSAWSSKTAFSTTGATSHSATLAVWAGLVKRICYQCRDALLNESAESCTTFSVSAKPKVGGFN